MRSLLLATSLTGTISIGCAVPEYKIPDVEAVGGHDEPGGSDSKGGASVTGGQNSGGASTSAGTSSAGGAIASGGLGGVSAVNAGGTFGFASDVSSGGALGTGGVSATGGTTGEGGALQTGGALAFEGSNQSGGTIATGGLSNTGGDLVTGGLSNTGGTLEGGASPTGGRSMGSSPSGGASTTGGRSATGGSLSAGGSTSASCASGYVFCDNFESYTLGSLVTPWAAGAGIWSVVSDATAPVGDRQVYANKSASNSNSQAGSNVYTNATIEARIRVTSFASNSSSNAAGIFLRNNGTYDYDLSLGGDGTLNLRRTQATSTLHTCSSGAATAKSGVSITEADCSPTGFCSAGWFKVKLAITGTISAGVTITAYVDATASGTYTQAFQCVQNTDSSTYMVGSGTAGVFSKGSAQAEYDDVLISVP
jgi:hypothetical protein